MSACVFRGSLGAQKYHPREREAIKGLECVIREQHLLLSVWAMDLSLLVAELK